jgi:hypothetical protein
VIHPGIVMPKDIFISYSRRDQEFVTRLASDLDAQVAGVWFDQSAIQAGENWQAEIMEGISECKAFILVLSPDAMESRYVREEVNKALELGKTIFPILYRPAQWTDQIGTIVKEIQTLDLRSGSYTDNFHRLVDGLIEAGAGKATGERPFLRQPTKPSLKAVFRKIPGWALAWSLGWLAFWAVIFICLFILMALQNNAGTEDIFNFLAVLFSGMVGGGAGGLVAGLFTMLALRPYAPSISWKHMSPTIRIWGISGPLGMIVAGIITVITLAVGNIGATTAFPNCSAIEFDECVGQIFGVALGATFAIIIITLLLFLLFVSIAWFLTGMFAGWLSVRHIRRLEPGITRRQGWSVSAGWGCGAIVAAAIMLLTLGILSRVFEL